MNYRLKNLPLIKMVVGIVFVILLNIGELISKNTSELSISLEVWNLMFPGCNEGKISLIQVLPKITPIWVMVLLFSNEIVKGRDLDDLYFFTRFKSRFQWYVYKSARMIFYIAFFLVVYMGFYLWLASWVTCKQWELKDVQNALFLYVVLFLYTLCHCVLGNIIRSIVLEERVTLIQIGEFLGELLLIGSVSFVDVAWIQIINPTYYLIQYYIMDSSQKGIGMVWLCVINIVVLEIGKYIVKKAEVGLIREEM